MDEDDESTSVFPEASAAPVPLVPVVEPLAEPDSPLSPEDVPPDVDSGGRSTTSIISTYSRSIFGRRTVSIGLENQATCPGVIMSRTKSVAPL